MRRISLVLLISLLLGLVPGPARGQDANVSVVINGREQAFSDPPFIESGRTLVPLRAIFEALGARVTWDNATKTVTASRGRRLITLTIGARTAKVNLEPVTLDTPGVIRAGRTYVPLRFVSEALGAAVGWDAADRAVLISDLQVLAAGSDPKAVALAQKTATFTGAVDGDLAARAVLGPGESWGVDTVASITGQVRGADAYYRLEQFTSFGAVQTRAEVAGRGGRTWLKAGNDAAFRLVAGPARLALLGIAGGVDPLRPLGTPLAEGVSAVSLGESRTINGETYQQLKIRFDRIRLHPYFNELAQHFRGRFYPDLYSDEMDATLLVRSDGFAREVDVRIGYFTAWNGVLDPTYINMTARWSDPAGPIQWPAGLPE